MLKTNATSNKNGWYMISPVNEVTQALVTPRQAMEIYLHIPANQDILTRENEQHFRFLITISQARGVGQG